MSEITETEAIQGLSQEAASKPVHFETEDGREFLIVPKGAGAYAVETITRPGWTQDNDALPDRIMQAVTVQTVESLIDYVNRFKDSDDTMLFADIARSTIVGALDYHTPSSAPEADGVETPGWNQHRASMVLPFSEEWKLWSAIDGKLMGQLEFARFIEENYPDIIAPAANALLEAVRDLQAHRKVSFIKAVRTASDNENFEYADETEAKTKGGIELPTKIVLGIPVYFGESVTELTGFLRWKLDDGNLQLGIKLSRAEHVRQAAFKQIVVRVTEGTGQPVVYGTYGPTGGVAPVTL